MDQAGKLARAYATLGVAAGASLEDARAAYLTWSELFSEVLVTIDERGAEGGADAPTEGPPGAEAGPAVTHAVLARHEIDLAWHAIEQSHIDGALFVRQARGCEGCGRSPAVRVTFFATRPGGVRARRTTTAALLCQDCGLRAQRRIQGSTLRRGWWGIAAPFANTRAIARNAAEARFLKRIDPPAPRRDARAAADGDLEGADGPRHAARRVIPWVIGVCAVALVIGIAVPTGSAQTPPPDPPAGGQPTAAETR